MRGYSAKALALLAARAADAKKGEEIALLHPGRRNPLAEYWLIVTANSRPHMESLEDAVEQALKAANRRPARRARPSSDAWRILDYGGLIVHIMTAQARAFYSLEKLHPDAPRMDWEGAGPRRGRPPARRSAHA